MNSAPPIHKFVLIGMPGAGKTTVGQKLAQQLGIDFVDTDQLLEQYFGESLQSQLDRLGYLAMRQREEQFVATCAFPARAVVATGGSVVYGPSAMNRLKQDGLILYLALSLETVKRRVDNWQQRGFSCAPGQGLQNVYEERLPLYRRYADVTLECDDLTVDEAVEALKKVCNNQSP